MATTSTRLDVFAIGLRDSTGAVVPSGKVRFYQPGTLVAQTVYADPTCATALPQPVTLNAYGQATIYTLEAVRCIAKNSAETTTIYDDVINLTRADAVYMTVAGVNNGAETTVENAFANVVAGLGADFKYRWKSNTSATARAYSYAIGELAVSVKDFGAVGDDSTDDTTAIQNAIESGAGNVYFPIGTYKITSHLRFLTGNGTQKFIGEGRGRSIVKNYSTTGDAFDLTGDGTQDYRIGMRDLTISASSGSSGRAVYVPGAGTVGVTLERVEVSGHAIGIYAGGDHAELRNCKVTYTGTSASSYGIYLGSQGLAAGCLVTGPGTGGSDTGIVIGGLSKADTCTVGTCKTGFSVGAGAGTQRSLALNCFASGCNVGFLAPASADTMTIVGCNASSCTTDLSIGASAANLTVVGSPFATYAGSVASYRDPLPIVSSNTANSASASATFTPDLASKNLQQFTGTYAVGAMALTIANPSNAAGLIQGSLVYIQLIKTGANAMNLTWGAAYLDADGSAFSGLTSVASNTSVCAVFRVAGSGTLVSILVGAAAAV